MGRVGREGPMPPTSQEMGGAGRGGEGLLPPTSQGGRVGRVGYGGEGLVPPFVLFLTKENSTKGWALGTWR